MPDRLLAGAEQGDHDRDRRHRAEPNQVKGVIRLRGAPTGLRAQHGAGLRIDALRWVAARRSPRRGLT